MAGRPTKYKVEYNEQAEKLCKLGATDMEMADFFEVEEKTINNWKLEHPEFLQSIKKGKAIADIEIANSLYERAKGCRIKVQQAIKVTTKKPDKNGWMTQTENIEIVELDQEVPPDTTAMIFWLKNRQPAKWRDKQEVQHSGAIETPITFILDERFKDEGNAGIPA